MYSNLVNKPVNNGGELNETEERNREFVVASGNATGFFDRGEKVFDAMSSPVVAAVKRHAYASMAKLSNADFRFLLMELRRKGNGVESLVPAHAVSAQRRHRRLDGFEVMPDCPAPMATARPCAVATTASLGVDFAFAAANRLLSLSTAGIIRLHVV